jgi:predicted double-glycine peptidase
MMKKLALLLIFAYGLSGCAVSKRKILDFPTTRQSFDYSCGPGAVQAVMAYYGKDFRESQLIDLLQTDKDEGTLIRDIVKIFNSEGFSTDVKENMTTSDLFGYIDKNIPVIVLIQAWGSETDFMNNYKNCWNDGHFVVAIGYTNKEVFFSDPALFNTGYIPIPEFLDRWHDYDEGDNKTNHLGIAVYGQEVKFVQKEVIRIK